MIYSQLVGKTILNTRPLKQAGPLAEAIEKEGGRCVMLPSFNVIPALEHGMASLTVNPEDIWIFMSQYAVEYALPWIKEKLAQKKSPQIIGVGTATAFALECAGLPVAGVPEEYSSEGVLKLPILQVIQQKNIFIFRGKSGRTLLDETLAQRGAHVRSFELYERVLPVWTKEQYAEIQNNPIDLALAMSVDSLTYFFSCLELPEKQRFLRHVPWLVLSQRIATQAEYMGIKRVYTVNHPAILMSIIESLESERKQIS